MAIHDGNKPLDGAIGPEGAIDSTWGRLEPLITADELKMRHLFGIPLVSPIKNPMTGKPDVMTDFQLDDHISQAVNLAEADTGLVIMPTEIIERHPFDKNEFQSLGFFQLRSKPIHSIQRLSVEVSNRDEVYVVPNDWISVSHLARGQINMIPLNIATVGGGFVPAVTNSGGAAFFLSILGQRAWIASFWRIQFTAGWPEGKLPSVVNQLIGTIAAMEILSMLGAAHAKTTSVSLGIDSMSQSIGTPGPNIYATRLQDLQVKRTSLMKKIKKMGGNLIVSGNL